MTDKLLSAFAELLLGLYRSRGTRPRAEVFHVRRYRSGLFVGPRLLRV